MAFQAGLPLDKFYSVYAGIVPREMNGDPKPGFVDVKQDLWMKKVLLFTETELITVHNQWIGHLQTFLGENADANQCHETMRRISAQMCEATDCYGLFNYVATVAEAPTSEEAPETKAVDVVAGVPIEQ